MFFKRARTESRPPAAPPAGLRSWTGVPLIQEKLDLINHAFGTFPIRSFADLGCTWQVEGAYTFRAIEDHRASPAVMVDTWIPEAMRERALRYRDLRIVQGSFGDLPIARAVGTVDAVFMFDVLLHQVKPDWDEVLDIWARFTSHFLIYNQQWIKSPATVRLIDLGREGYMKSVPRPQDPSIYEKLFAHLDEPVTPGSARTYRDSCLYWQWGITDADLVRKMLERGFIMQYFRNCGSAFGIEGFENHAFVFSKQ